MTSKCREVSYRDRLLEKLNFTWSTGPSISRARCLSEFWTGSPHWQVKAHAGERKLHVQERKEGTKAFKLQSQRKRNCVPLSGVLAFMAEACSLLESSSSLFNLKDACARRDLVATVQPPPRSLRSRKQAYVPIR